MPQCFLRLCQGIVLTALLIGCGGGDRREYADVSGKVSVNGNPLKMGTVTFQPAAGAPATGTIQADGTYTLKGVVGPNKVMIVSREAEAADAGASPAKRAAPPQSFVPEQYGTPSSTLSFDVKSGKNENANFDIK